MVLVARAEAAKALGVEPARINKWVADGAPVARKGQRGVGSLYDVSEIRKWLKAREQGSSDGLSLERERALLAQAQREKVERENRQRAGELVGIDDAIHAGVAYTKAWARKVRGIPRQARLQGIILTAEQEAALAAICREVLEDIARWRTVEELEEGAA